VQDRKQKRANVRLALILGAVSLAFLVAFVVMTVRHSG